MASVQVSVDVHLVLLQDGRILLGRRLGTKYGAGEYLVPAGRLEPNETIIDGVIREAEEEIGIEIDAADLDLAYVLHFRGDSDRLSLFFRTDRWKGAIANMEPDRCSGWEWHPADSLPEDTMSYAKHALGELFSGKNVGFWGW